MGNCDCDPLALTTAVNTLAVAIAGQLGDEDLELAAAVLTSWEIPWPPFPSSGASVPEAAGKKNKQTGRKARLFGVCGML